MNWEVMGKPSKLGLQMPGVVRGYTSVLLAVLLASGHSNVPIDIRTSVHVFPSFLPRVTKQRFDRSRTRSVWYIGPGSTSKGVPRSCGYPGHNNKVDRLPVDVPQIRR